MGRCDPTELVGLIYEAALGDGGAWTPFLRRLRDAMNGCQAALFIQGLDGAPSRMLSLGDPEYDRAYAEHYGAVNPWFTRGAHLIRPGAVVSSEWYPAESLRRSEFYAGFLAPQRMFYAINGFIFDRPGLAGNVAVAKRWSADGPGSDDLSLLERLMPHLQRVVELQRGLGASGVNAPTESVLNRLAQGVVLADHGGRVWFANAVAQTLLTHGRGLTISKRGELRAHLPQEDRLLRGLLRDAFRTAVLGEGKAGGVMALHGEEGKGCLQIHVSPIRGRVLAFDAEPVGVLCLISDPMARPRPSKTTLMGIFDLTPREADLAVHLADGCADLSDAARRMGVQLETARTHLRRLMDKTGAHRQAALVRLLLDSAVVQPVEESHDR